MVPDRITDAVTDWLSADATSPVPDALVELLKAGGTLRTGDPSPSNTERFEISVPKTLAAGSARSGSGRWGQLLSVAGLVMGTRLSLRTRGFEQMLHRLGRHAIYGKSTESAAAVIRIAAYDRVRRFVPLARNCLLDSLAQFRWLSRDGIGCRLVFGVTGEPFAAHCWLQSDEAILNDTYEHVSRFTPIMVL